MVQHFTGVTLNHIYRVWHHATTMYRNLPDSKSLRTTGACCLLALGKSHHFFLIKAFQEVLSHETLVEIELSYLISQCKMNSKRDCKQSLCPILAAEHKTPQQTKWMEQCHLYPHPFLSSTCTKKPTGE